MTQGLKILITGAAGFIGSHLTEHLVSKGYSVRAFVHYNSFNNWGWLEDSSVKNDIEVITGDLRDFDSVSKAVKGTEKIYHLGALIGIPYSYESPLAYVKTNIEGTYNVLEAGRRQSVKKILITSTSEVYGTAKYVPIDEAHPLQPQSPYSATKIAADNLALSYFLSFNTPVVVARPFNTYGPRQSARAIIPTIATQLLGGLEKVRLGNLNPTRDLTYVDDSTRAIEIISETDKFLGKAVNIGTGSEISIGALFEKLSQITQVKASVEHDEGRRRSDTSEVQRLLSNNEFLRKNTNWLPKYSIDQGLELTVKWLKENLHQYKFGTYNV